MKALVFSRKPVRYAAAAVAGRVSPGRGARVGPLSLKDIDEPELPGADWVRFRPRLAGICGSDLATLDGKSSRYFEPIVSFPFTPGHEVVGELDDGSRAVLVPVLTCETASRAAAVPDVRRRPHQPVRAHRVRSPRAGAAERLLHRHRRRMVDRDGRPPQPARAGSRRHDRRSRGHGRAHGMRRARRDRGGQRGDGRGDRCRHARPADDRRAAKRRRASAPSSPRPSTPSSVAWPASSAPTRSSSLANWPGRFAPRPGRSWSRDSSPDGVGTVVDCVGSEASLTQALQVVAPGGDVIVVGMPGHVSLDLTSLWHRETGLRGLLRVHPRRLRSCHDAGGRRRPRPAGQRHLSARPLRRRGRARSHRRVPRRGQDRLRPPRREAPMKALTTRIWVI